MFPKPWIFIIRNQRPIESFFKEQRNYCTRLSIAACRQLFYDPRDVVRENKITGGLVNS